MPRHYHRQTTSTTPSITVIIIFILTVFVMPASTVCSISTISEQVFTVDPSATAADSFVILQKNNYQSGCNGQASFAIVDASHNPLVSSYVTITSNTGMVSIKKHTPYTIELKIKIIESTDYYSNLFRIVVSCDSPVVASTFTIPDTVREVPGTAQATGPDFTVFDIGTVITGGDCSLSFKIISSPSGSQYSGNFVAISGKLLQIDSDVVDLQAAYVEIYNGATLLKTTNTFSLQTKCGLSSNTVGISASTFTFTQQSPPVNPVVSLGALT